MSNRYRYQSAEDRELDALARDTAEDPDSPVYDSWPNDEYYD